MNWFLLALIAPLAWSVSNYIDKFILSGTDDGKNRSGGLLILSSLVSIIFAVLVLWHTGTSALNIGSQPIGALILSGMFEALYIYFYFCALEKESTTMINVLFQFVPVFGILLGYAFLREVATLKQVIAVLFILLGTLFFLFKKGERLAVRPKIILLMTASTVCAALYDVVFKMAIDGKPFWTGVFWQYIGIGLLGLIMFISIPEHRSEFFSLLKKQKSTAIVYTSFAEILNIVAVLATNAAILLAPVALVLSVGSVQPLFIYIEGIILFILFPTLFNVAEKPSLKPQYIFGILLVCLGGFLIY